MRRSTGCRQAQGLTLLEALVVGSLLSVVMGAIVLSFLTSQRAYTSSEAYLSVQDEARRALDAMTKELHAAGGNIATGAGWLQFQRVLGFNLALPCPPSAVCWGAQDAAGADQFGWSIRYRLDAPKKQLVREILDAGAGVQGQQILANDVTQLTFAYTPGAVRTIRITIDVRRTSTFLPGGSMGTTPTPATSLITTVKLRN
ncbi:MAG: hypothetical protein HY737_07185 [Candidatus Omnitrophica bacterium]|nr:hypothetical protein [Candidatus Omnitrophota bacterium]